MKEDVVIIIGLDAHKRTHTAVAANEVGRELGRCTVPATTDGHLALLRWAAEWPERTFAVEDCRHLTRRLEPDLLAAGERLMRVPPKLMAGARRSARERGKSDPIDALSVARAALREPDLSVAELDGPTRDLRLLVDHRETLVRERSRLQNRLRWLAVGHEPVRYQDLIVSQRPRAAPPKPPRARGNPPSLERPTANRPWRTADLNHSG